MEKAQLTRYAMLVQHTVDLVRVRVDLGSYMTAPFFQLPVASVPRELSEKKNIFWAFLLETYLTLWAFLRSFPIKKRSLEYCFSETNILWLCTSFLLHKVKKIFGRYQVKALQAYACKQIPGLSLSQLPP